MLRTQTTKEGQATRIKDVSPWFSIDLEEQQKQDVCQEYGATGPGKGGTGTGMVECIPHPRRECPLLWLAPLQHKA